MRVFEKLKSSGGEGGGGESFFHHVVEGGEGGGRGQAHSDNGTQRGHIIQVKTVTFKRKNSFHFYIISFKRTYLNCNLTNF